MNNDTNTDTPPTATSRHALDVWLTMWNTGGDIAREICADDFRIRFGSTEADGSTPGDDIRTAEDFARYLDHYREQHPGIVFTKVADAIDGAHGRMLWDVDAGDLHTGGVDVFDFAEDGRITRVWSVTGARPMH